MSSQSVGAIDSLNAQMQRAQREAEELHLIVDLESLSAQSQVERIKTLAQTARGAMAQAAALMKEKFSANRVERRQHRALLANLYLDAALVELHLEFFRLRWLIPSVGSIPSLLQDTEEILRKFTRRLVNARLRLTSFQYHRISIVLRAWADRLGPTATSDIRWLEASAGVVRALRLAAQKYRTRELWTSVWERSRGERSFLGRTRTFIHALARSFYGMVAGYGLRGDRFVGALAIALAIFAGIYWLLDMLAGCAQAALRLQSVLNYLLFSLGSFTNASETGAPVCANSAGPTHDIAVLESLLGYLMLGILISIFWTSGHQATVESSNIRLHDDDSAMAHPQDTFGDHQ